jgi:hypothetical protein
VVAWSNYLWVLAWQRMVADVVSAAILEIVATTQVSVDSNSPCSNA